LLVNRGRPLGGLGFFVAFFRAGSGSIFSVFVEA